MTTPLRVPWSRWNTKQYILAALLGMLATVAVVASISISLAPAHIAFFVRDANITQAYKIGNDGRNLSYLYYNLTLVANNTSRRTAVSYGSLTVDIWESETAWITTEVNTSAVLPGWLPPGNTTTVKVGVEWYHQYDEETPPTADGAKTPPAPKPPQVFSNVSVDSSSSGSGRCVAKWPNCRVVVEAKVWFKFAGVPTLPYTVKVCFPVNFWDGTSGLVNCTC